MSLMKKSAQKARAQACCLLPTYSADTFGVCSALFELGGMVVIHDPSGCNSTYTTHDEPRWYDTDSLIFISAMNEYDAILGRDDRLLSNLIETVRAERPRFLCLIPSQIAYLIATDLQAIARAVERATGVPSFTLPTNSMHDAERGIYLALEEIARRIPPSSARTGSSRLRVNVLGVTPLDFPLAGTRQSLADFLAQADATLQSCWAMDCTYEELCTAAAADASLVVSYGGLGAARVLQERFGIPYVIGAPIGPLKAPLAAALRETARHPSCRAQSGASANASTGIRAAAFAEPGANDFRQAALLRGPSAARSWEDMWPEALLPLLRADSDGSSVSAVRIVGESILAASLAAALQAAGGRHARLIVPVSHERCLLPPDACVFPTETALTAELAHSPALLADPLYHALCPPDLPLLPLPHAACSGRIYEAQQRDLLDDEVFSALLRELRQNVPLQND